MLHNNIEYEYDTVEDKYVLCDSRLYARHLKGELRPYTEKFLLIDYKLVKRRTLKWESFCNINKLNFVDLKFFENVKFYTSGRTNETIFTFQPFKPELKDIIKLEKSLEGSTHRIYMDYKKSWIIPGLTPLILIARSSSEETYLAKFDPNIPHDKNGFRKKNDPLLF